MFNIVERNLRNKENRRFISNILSLSLLQGANYILPLVTLPYLIRVLGMELFGQLAFATAVNVYFVLISDYGFNLTATRQISTNRDKNDKLNEIYSSVIVSKILLCSLSFFILVLAILIIPRFSENWELHLLNFSTVIGYTLTPTWLFHGMEKMKILVYLNITAKLIFTILIFAFVDGPDDYLLVPAFTGLGYILSAVGSLIIVQRILSVNFQKQNLAKIKFQLYNGWHVFYSSVAVNLYTVSTVVILGILTNDTTVGYYAAADNVIKAIKGLFTPISQSMFPLVAKKIKKDSAHAIYFVDKVTKAASLIMFFICALLFLLSEQIINVVTGESHFLSIILLRIMAFVPLLVTLSNIFGVQIMLNFDYKREFSRILSISAVIGLLMSLLLVPKFGAIGSAITIIIVEANVTIMMYLFQRRYIRNSNDR